MADQLEAQTCPACEAATVVYDYLQGVSVCERCGRVTDDVDLAPQVFDSATSRPGGVFVGPRDSGLGASGQLLHGSAAGRLVQRARPKDPIVKMRAVLAALAAQLGLPPRVRTHADRYLEQLTPRLAGAWRREHVAAAAAYAAVRVNQVPLTLLDVAAALQADMFVLGRCYRASLQLLDLRPPQLRPADLLPRTVARVMPGAPAGAAAVQRDAELALAWMDAHLVGRQHPLVALGAAVMVACEMNSVAVGLAHVAGALHVWRDCLGSKLQQVRARLLEFQDLLPFAGQLTHKNVMSHARTIFRLMSVLEAGPPGGGAGLPAREAGAGAPPAPQAPRGQGGEEPQAAALAALAAAAAAAASLEPPRGKRPRYMQHVGGGAQAVAEAGKTRPSSKRRKGVQPASPAASDEGGGGGGGSLGSADDLSEAELEGYLRTAEEVELLEEVYKARGDG
jgi:hypothetical protein